VTIRGDSVAAYCCAFLLGKAGFSVELAPADRPKLPAIMLGDRAIALIRDILEQPGLLAEAPRIRRRVVAWGSAAAPADLEHSAVVVSEATLLEALRPRVASEGVRDFAWDILSTRPLPTLSIEHCFGSRTASVVSATLRSTSDHSACWIESLEEGWLFLTPGWLLAVGAPVDTLLATSRVVAHEVIECGAEDGTFPASPRIAFPLCAPGWLACGSAAMAFDPICGDGTAHAMREAILAAAVIRALENRGSAEDSSAVSSGRPHFMTWSEGSSGAMLSWVQGLTSDIGCGAWNWKRYVEFFLTDRDFTSELTVQKAPELTIRTKRGQPLGSF
jgi:hypothetical protein